MGRESELRGVLSIAFTALTWIADGIAFVVFELAGLFGGETRHRGR
jgi:hypothetical protein